jgi:hypothetical protein
MDVITTHLDPALRAGYGEFTAVRTELMAVKGTGAVRCDIKLAYRSKPVITVQMEAAGVEGGMGSEIDLVPARPLDHVGLNGPAVVPCVAIRWQIAQKLHACTELHTDRQNDRFRDLLDLQLLAGLVRDDGWPAVHAACTEVFAGRAKQAWPPDIVVYESWGPGYRTLTEETEFSIHDVAEAAQRIRQLVTRIDHAGSTETGGSGSSTPPV